MAMTLPHIPPSLGHSFNMLNSQQWYVGERGPEIFVSAYTGTRKVCGVTKYRANELHDGQWFIDRGELEARKATKQVVTLTLVVCALAGAAWWFA